MDRGGLSGALEARRFEWSLHALEQMAARAIPQADVLAAVIEGAEIEDYPDNGPFASALFLGRTRDGRPLHAVAAYDADAGRAYVVTAYVPDLDHFEGDWATRRRP